MYQDRILQGIIKNAIKANLGVDNIEIDFNNGTESNNYWLIDECMSINITWDNASYVLIVSDMPGNCAYKMIYDIGFTRTSKAYLLPKIMGAIADVFILGGRASMVMITASSRESKAWYNEIDDIVNNTINKVSMTVNRNRGRGYSLIKTVVVSKYNDVSIMQNKTAITDEESDALSTISNDRLDSINKAYADIDKEAEKTGKYDEEICFFE